MDIAIITSTHDPASINIREELLKQAPFTEFTHSTIPCMKYKNYFLYTLPTPMVHAEEIDKTIDADLFIFASVHRSTSSTTPIFTAHALGNWGAADIGGKPSTLVPAPSHYIADALMQMDTRAAKIGFTVGQEATHHGPFLTKPAMFIEMGPTEKEWKNTNAAEVIATTLLNIRKYHAKHTAVALGGMHIHAKYLQMVKEQNIAIGHICPKYALTHLTKEILLQAINQSVPKTDTLILDWKGLGQEKQKIKELADSSHTSHNIEVLRTDKM